MHSHVHAPVLGTQIYCVLRCTCTKHCPEFTGGTYIETVDDGYRCDGALHGPHVLVGTHIKTVDDGYGRDGALHGPHALVERVLGFLGADDRPRRTVVDDLTVRFLRARRRLSTTTTTQVT